MTEGLRHRQPADKEHSTCTQAAFSPQSVMHAASAPKIIMRVQLSSSNSKNKISQYHVSRHAQNQI